MKLLQAKGHKALPVNPALSDIEGTKVYPSPSAIVEPVDTLTMYLGPNRSDPLIDEILQFRPQRVIFNPGAENPRLMAALEREGIEVLEACTLVLLQTGQF